LGFQDAQALIRLASMESHLAQTSDNAHVSSLRLLSEEIKGDAHISTLVIDEERPAHPVLRCLLEYDNHQVLEASHSRGRSADLLITDLAMPTLYGLDFILD